MRLLLVELGRFRSRRAVVLMLAAGLVLVAYLVANTVWSTRSLSATEVAGAKEAAAQEQVQIDKDYQRCLDDPQTMFPDATEADCERYEADYHWYLSRQPLSLVEERNDTGKAAIVLLAGLAVIIGATFAGADWASGSMSNQLLFRPVRTQVWLAKAASVALGVTVAAAVILGLMWAVYFLAAESRGIGHPDAFVGDLMAGLGRGLLLVAGGSLGGYALTMLLRSTVGTLAVLFAYTAGGEALVAALPIDRVQQWGITSNIWAWLDDGHRLYDQSIVCPPEGECDQSFLIGLAHGAWYLFGLLALVTVVSLLAFRRRDVP